MSDPPTLADIMGAIADQIEAALSPSVPGVQVDPKLNFNPTPPCIDVYPADPFMEQTAMPVASQEVTFVIRARVTTADHEAGQDLLLDLLDPRGSSSLAAALAADSTFSGAVADSAVDSPSGYIVYESPGGSGALLGSEWRLRVEL